MIWRALAPVKVASLPDAVITSASGGQVNASGDLLGNVTVGSEPGQHITINNNPVITGSSQ